MSARRPVPDAERRQQLAQARRIVHLTLQPIELDARVARAVSALRASGRDVVVVAPGHGFQRPPMSLGRKLRIGLCYGSGARLGLAAAWAAFWLFADHRAALRAVLDARPDAIHAHDWDALIVAVRAARMLQVPLVYDAHELATEMHLERRFWRWTVRPLIARLERACIGEADAVIAVSDGLAARMGDIYELRRPAVLVRNIPDIAPAVYAARPQRGERMLLHYHGVLAEGRGLIELVRAMALLAPRFRLRLTGPWRQRRLRRALTQEIAGLGLAGQVEINPPVPFDMLVAHAADADIGVTLLSGPGHHNRFALPNKVFEYMYAGLFVFCAQSEEIARLVREHDCGLALAKCDPQAIAAGLQGLDRDAVDRGRAAARAAADKLTWRCEAEQLLSLYGEGRQGR